MYAKVAIVVQSHLTDAIYDIQSPGYIDPIIRIKFVKKLLSEYAMDSMVDEDYLNRLWQSIEASEAENSVEQMA